MFIIRFAAKAGLLMVIFGIVSLVTAITQRKLETLSIEAIATRKPDSRWVRIEGGVFDLTNASAISFRAVDTPLKLYVPLVKPDHDAEKDLIHALVVTDDRTILKLYKEFQEAGDASVTQGVEFALKDAARLRASRAVQGLILSDFERGGYEERKMSKSYENGLAEEVIIMEEGQKPSFAGAIAMMGGGLVLFIGCQFLIRTFAKKTAVPPPLPPTIPPPLPRSR